MHVRLRDGVEFELSTGERVVADADEPAGDINLLSHAHGDHLYGSSPPPLVCSRATADLAGVRRDRPPEVTRDQAVDLYPAGHVAGSRAALVTDPGTGQQLLYTGDCSTRDRFYLDSFEPPAADVLIVESTYGKPEFELPPQREVVAEIRGWLRDTRDRPVLLFGYPLGRAQKLALLAGEERDGLYTTDAIACINRTVETHYDVSFRDEPYEEDIELSAGDALLLPAQTNKLAFVEHLRESHDAPKAGFSGWAVTESFKYRGDYDITFPLSDHCGFEDLVALVKTVNPEEVYVHHGFAQAFATYLTSEGYDATALIRNQTTLGQF